MIAAMTARRLRESRPGSSAVGESPDGTEFELLDKDATAPMNDDQEACGGGRAKQLGREGAEILHRGRIEGRDIDQAVIGSSDHEVVVEQAPAEAE